MDVSVPTTDSGEQPAAEPIRRPAAWHRYFPLAALAVLTLAGAALRYAYATRSGMWRDEALTMGIIGAPDFWDYVFHHDSHPPLYYLLNKVWWVFFGATEPSSLALSVLFGVALIPAIFYAGRAMFSTRTAVIAAALAAFAPFAAEYSGVLRPYSLLPLLTLGSLTALWAGLRHGGRKRWAAYAVLTALMIYAHNWGVLIAASEGLVAALWLLWRRPGWKPVQAWALAQVAIAALYAPWVPVLLEQARHAGHVPQAWLSTNDWAYTWRNLGTVFQMFAKSVLSLPQTLWTAGLLAGAAGWVLTEERKGEHAKWDLLPAFLLVGVPTVALLVAFAASGHSNLVHEKCFLALAPAAFLLVARAIASLPFQPTVSVVLTGILIYMYADQARQALPYMKSDAREVAAVVAANTQPDDLIVVVPEWIASSFNYYYAPNNRQIVFPHEGKKVLISFRDVARRFADPKAYHDTMAAVKAQHAAGKRTWIVADAISFYDNSEPPKGPEVPGHYHPKDYAALGYLRARQLQADIKAVYGEPTFVSSGTGRPLGYETVIAKLFTPSAPSRLKGSPDGK